MDAGHAGAPGAAGGQAYALSGNFTALHLRDRLPCDARAAGPSPTTRRGAALVLAGLGHRGGGGRLKPLPPVRLQALARAASAAALASTTNT
jgi:hypothetical protein